jgi:uncharacterized protein (DUF4415 family)
MSDNPFSEGSDSKDKPNAEGSAEAARDFAETSREDGESKLTVRVSTDLYARFKRRCERGELSMSAAVRRFMKRAIANSTDQL